MSICRWHSKEGRDLLKSKGWRDTQNSKGNIIRKASEGIGKSKAVAFKNEKDDK